VPRREHCPELTERRIEHLVALYDEVSPNMRRALDVLIQHAPQRLTFQELEGILGWPRGYFASVFGGFRGPRGKNCPRPFHLCDPGLSETREWELWLDARQAAALRAAR
jgi:hypothetical protein